MSILNKVESINNLLKNSNYIQVYEELKSSIGLASNKEQLISFFKCLLYKALEKRVGAAYECVDINSALITSRAKRFMSSGLPIEDLFSIGQFGLIDAVFNFDQNRGIRLSTFAVPRIDGHIIRYLTRRYNDLRDKEISMNEQIYNDSDGEDTIEDTLGTSSEIVEEQAFLYTARKDLHELISKLDEREKIILSYRLGLLDKEFTQKELADMFGVSQVQVSRIERMAVAEVSRKMRKMYKIEGSGYIISKNGRKIIDFDMLNTDAVNYFADKYIFVNEKYAGQRPVHEEIKDVLRRVPFRGAIFLIEAHGLFDKCEKDENELSILEELSYDEAKEFRQYLIAKIQEHFGVEKVVVKFTPKEIFKSEKVSKKSIEVEKEQEIQAGEVITYSIQELREKLIEENNLKMLNILDAKPKEKQKKEIKPNVNFWGSIKPVKDIATPKRQKKQTPKRQTMIRQTSKKQTKVDQLVIILEGLKERGILDEGISRLTQKQKDVLAKVIENEETFEVSVRSMAKELKMEKSSIDVRLKLCIKKLHEITELYDNGKLQKVIKKEAQPKTRLNKPQKQTKKYKKVKAAQRLGKLVQSIGNENEFSELINNLPKLEADIINSVLNSNDSKRLTYAEIGEPHNLKPEMVRYYLKKSIIALEKIYEAKQNNVTKINSESETLEKRAVISSEKLNEWAVKLFINRYIIAGRNLNIELTKEVLAESFMDLSEREFVVLCEMHGLLDGVEKDANILAKRSGISQATVAKLRKQAVIKIQKSLGIEPIIVNFRSSGLSEWASQSNMALISSQLKVDGFATLKNNPAQKELVKERGGIDNKGSDASNMLVRVEKRLRQIVGQLKQKGLLDNYVNLLPMQQKTVVEKLSGLNDEDAKSVDEIIKEYNKMPKKGAKNDNTNAVYLVILAAAKSLEKAYNNLIKEETASKSFNLGEIKEINYEMPIGLKSISTMLTLEEWISCLTSGEAITLIEANGLFGRKKKTLEEIAEMYGESHECIERRINRGYYKINKLQEGNAVQRIKT